MDCRCLALVIVFEPQRKRLGVNKTQTREPTNHILPQTHTAPEDFLLSPPVPPPSTGGTGNGSSSFCSSAEVRIQPFRNQTLLTSHRVNRVNSALHLENPNWGFGIPLLVAEIRVQDNRRGQIAVPQRGQLIVSIILQLNYRLTLTLSAAFLMEIGALISRDWHWFGALLSR